MATVPVAMAAAAKYLRVLLMIFPSAKYLRPFASYHTQCVRVSNEMITKCSNFQADCIDLLQRQ
jgi:hypothetical protein